MCNFIISVETIHEKAQREMSAAENLFRRPRVRQVRIYTALLTFSLLLGKIPLYRPKMIPIRRDISM